MGIDEERALIDAALAVMRRQGADLTVVDVLAEAGLSTRAFYRHFESKDALILAIYAHDARRVQDGMKRRLGSAMSPRLALELWIDETLSLAYDARRARRTRPLAAEGFRLQSQFPAEFEAIVAAALDPLVEVLQEIPSAEPRRDARSIYAITWTLVNERLQGSNLKLAHARQHVLRFCLPAVGLAE